MLDSLFSWTTLAIAAAALILILLVYRLLARFNLTVRFRGAVSVSPWAQKPCPHLGMLDEPFVHRDDPNEEHRCYLWMQRDRIDLTHQKGFCLSSAHSRCPWLGIAPPAAKPPISSRLRATMPTLGANILVTIVDVASGFYLWLVPKLRRAAYKVKRWAPFLVMIAVFVAREVAPRVAVAARRIGNTSAIAAGMAYEWLAPQVKKAARRSKAQVQRAFARPSRPTPSTTPAIQLDNPSYAGPQPGVELTGALNPTMAPVEPMPITGVDVPVWPVPGLQPSPTLGALNHVDSLIEQGKSAGMTGNRKLAYSLFSLALDLDPVRDEAWLWKGAMTDNSEERFACFKQALDINPDNRKAQQALQQVEPKAWAALSALREAAVSPQSSVDEAPALAAFASDEALVSAAVVAMERGDDDGAYRLFARATELNPGSEKAWFLRAKTAPTLDEVIYSLQQALAINPGNEKVRANLLWAIQRQQREVVVKESEHKVAVTESQTKEPAKPRRNFVAAGFRWLAALTCLALGAYWVSAALLPLSDLPDLRLLVDEIQRTTEIDLESARPLYDSATRWLPGLTWVSLPWYKKLEITSGYNLLEMVPYTIGFLYLFVAIGVARREAWSRLWALGITILSIALGNTFSASSEATALIVALGFATMLTLFVSRSEFKRDTSTSTFKGLNTDQRIHSYSSFRKG